MWNERRMTSGPGQTKAGAASCRLDAIGGGSGLSLVAQQLRTPAGAQAAKSIEPLRGTTSFPARMFIRHPNVRESPDQERRAVGKQRGPLKDSRAGDRPITASAVGARAGELLPSPIWSAGATQPSARYECRCQSGRTPTHGVTIRNRRPELYKHVYKT